MIGVIRIGTEQATDRRAKRRNRLPRIGIKDVSFKPEEISNSATTVYLYGDVAVVTSAYRTKGTDGGKPFIHRGRFTDTWVKINGKWTCVADHETLIH